MGMINATITHYFLVCCSDILLYHFMYLLLTAVLIFHVSFLNADISL
jgi:hypothetical protein